MQGHVHQFHGLNIAKLFRTNLQSSLYFQTVMDRYCNLLVVDYLFMKVIISYMVWIS